MRDRAVVDALEHVRAGLGEGDRAGRELVLLLVHGDRLDHGAAGRRLSGGGVRGRSGLALGAAVAAAAARKDGYDDNDGTEQTGLMRPHVSRYGASRLLVFGLGRVEAEAERHEGIRTAQY